MKSFLKIQKSGMKMHNGISDVITAEILLIKGHRSSQHNEYNQTADHKNLDCYKKFKDDLAKLINNQIQ